MLDPVSQACANEFRAAWRESHEGWAFELPDLHLGRPVVRGAFIDFPVWGGATVTSRGYDLSSTDLTAEERTGTPSSPSLSPPQ